MSQVINQTNENQNLSLEIDVVKFEQKMITNLKELEDKISKVDNWSKAEYRFIVNFFTNLWKFLESKYSNEVDPIEYLYYLYYQKKVTTRDIYDEFASMWWYNNKLGTSIKEMMINVLKWPLDWKIERKTIGKRERHTSESSYVEKSKQDVRDILKEDYKELKRKWINNPKNITWDEFDKLSTETQSIVIRYRHLLINKVFLTKNKILFSRTLVAMESGVSNWKKDLLEKFPLEWLKKEAISYPLNQIYI